jgi:uncharacterized protein YdhG (YjbR/CyaY superfamily)
MMKEKEEYSSIDEYIGSFPSDLQKKLIEIRRIIKKNAPDATERISYRMPTFYLNGNLVHFAGYSKHIGFYPTPNGIEAFKGEFKDYKYSKGAVQFPLDEPLPVDLIKRIVRFRVAENTKGK